ncbi:hypothetical protein [Sorangium sp. So ce1151]
MNRQDVKSAERETQEYLSSIFSLGVLGALGGSLAVFSAGDFLVLWRKR